MSDDSQVENTPYCMGDSFQARNVKEMNAKMGYHNMGDRANTPVAPTSMKAAKSDPQLGSKLPKD